MRMLRKIMSLFLTFCMLISYCTVFAAENSCGDNATWNYNSTTETLTISGTGATKDYNSSSGVPWYSYRNDITNIVIEEGITYIGRNICQYGINVQIPSTVTNIADTAFWSVKNITVAKDNSNYKSVNGILFNKDMTKLVCFSNKTFSTYTVPDTVTEIGPYSFMFAKIDHLVIPNSVTTIGTNAFQQCLIKTINIPDSVTSLDGKTFFACNYVLENINVSENNPYITSVNGILFNKDMTTLIYFPATRTEEYTIPNSVTTIGDYAFNYSNASTVNMHDNISAINSNAFLQSAITSVNIPPKVTVIEESAFSNSKINNLIIPETVKTIKGYAFMNCKNLATVTISKGVETIGRQAFYNCSKLTDLTVESGKIENLTFFNCTSLVNVNLKEGVTAISVSAFSGCTSLVELTIPKTVSKIQNLINDCTSLTDMHLLSESAEIYIGDVISYGAALPIPKNITIHAYCNNEKTTSQYFLTPYNYAHEYKNKFVSLGHKYGDWTIIKEATPTEQGKKIRTCVCGDEESEYFSYEGITDIIISNPNIELNAGDESKINITTQPENADTKKITFTSSNNDIVTVDNEGNIKAINPGEVAITITDGYIEKTVIVKVNKIAVESISAKVEKTEIFVNEKTEIKTIVLPDNATDKTLFFSSSDTNIATVENGIITGIAPGNATITISSVDNPDIKTTINITINQPVTNIETDSEITLDVGDKKQIKTTITPNNASDKRLSFVSSNSSVVTVDNGGNIIALKKGEAIITIKATDGSGIKTETNVIIKQPITDIEIPSEILLNISDEIKIPVTIKPDDASDKTVSFYSLNEEIATVDNEGNLKAISKGDVVIVVTAGDITKNIQVKVKQPVVDIFIPSNNITIDVGNTKNLNAEIKPSDANNKNLIYISDNPKVIEVDTEGNITAIAPGTTTIKITSEENEEIFKEINITVVQSALDLFVPENMKINVGENKEIKAVVGPENTTDKTIVFSSNNSDVVTVDNKGKITGIKQGSAIVTAETSNGIKKEINITVVQPITDIIVPEELKVDIGKSKIMNVVITPDDATDKTLIFSSSDKNIVTVDEKGKITGINKGNATIKIVTADDSDIVAEISVTVEQPVNNIEVTTEKITLNIGENEKLNVTVLPEDAANKKLIFSTNNSDVATVDSEGNIKAHSRGDAVITVTSVNNSSASKKINVKVVQPITDIIIPSNDITVNIGEEKNIGVITEPSDADNKKLTYISSDENIVKIDDNGNIIPIGPGETTVTIKTNDGSNIEKIINIIIKQPVTDIVVPENIIININEKKNINAVIKPANASDKNLTFVSSNEKIVVVNNEGDIEAISKGNAIITVSSNSGITKNINITVKQPINDIIIPDSDITVEIGGTIKNINAEIIPDDASDKKLIYTSSDNDVAEVDNEGNIIPHKPGTTVITVKSESGIEKEITITIKQPVLELITIKELTLNVGNKEKLEVLVKPDNASDKKLTFVSSDPSVVTVDDEGNIIAVNKGEAIITASIASGLSVNTKITVKQPITEIVTPEKIVLNLGENKNIEAIAKPNDASHPFVTYESSDKSIVVVDKDGNISAVGVGEAFITIISADGSNVKKKVLIAVNQPVTDIEITTPKDLTIDVGQSSKIEAFAKPNDAADKNITYTSSDNSVITVDKDGNITAIAPGNATVKVSAANGIFTEINIVVKQPVTEVIVPSKIVIQKGETKKLDVVIKPDNASDKTVSYKTYNNNVITINTDGEITGINLGTVIITIKVGDITKNIKVIVKENISDNENNNSDNNDNNTNNSENNNSGNNNSNNNTNNNTPDTENDNSGIGESEQEPEGENNNIKPEDQYGNNSETIKPDKKPENNNEIIKPNKNPVIVKPNDIITKPNDDIKEENNEENKKEEENLVIDIEKPELYVGEKTFIIVNKNVSFTSSNSSVIRVDESGKVTAVGEGAAAVTIRYGDKFEKVVFVVKNKSDFSLEFPKEIEIGKTEKIKITTNSDMKYSVKYFISNPDVVTVDNNGNLTVLKEGKSEIEVRVMFEDGSIATKIIEINATGTPAIQDCVESNHVFCVIIIVLLIVTVIGSNIVTYHCAKKDKEV